MPVKNYDTLLLLKSMAANYPILSDLGLTLPKMPVAIVEPEQSYVLTALMDDGHSKTIDEHCREKDIAKILLSTYSAPIVYRYSNSGKGREFFRELAEAVKKGSFATNEISGLVISVAENTEFGIPTEDVFTIFMDDDLRKVKHPELTNVVPKSTQLSVVYDELRTHMVIKDSPTLAAWKAAACFIYPCLPVKHRSKIFSELLDLTEELVRQNDNAKSTDDLEELFVVTINEWQMKTGFSDIVELPYIDREAEEKLQEEIFYTEDYIFLSERLFKKIIAPLKAVYPVTTILKSLVNSGFIIPSTNYTYTAKMGYYKSDGEYARSSMIRIKRKRLNRLGEPDFIENCF